MNTDAQRLTHPSCETAVNRSDNGLLESRTCLESTVPPETDNGLPEAQPVPQVNRSGLSKLQRRILDIATEGRRRKLTGEPEPWDDPQAHYYALDTAGLERWRTTASDVSFAQLMHRIYGYDSGTPGGRAKLRLGWNSCGLGKNSFCPAKIGRNKYNAAKAALSRAVLRLEQRGLVVVYTKMLMTVDTGAKSIALTESAP